ncbi:6-carboxytetrahydropterin synthase QueD [Ferroacidibacillus organovorans]|uniref:6-carboxy-5,6,7,8-tetrahydropterin synthase n=1 Tax=Ferroacidibacillus organovorans TaxID=1765683 RepID=A0A124IW12_9BACL|nr:6-carboxytetrahydropterin synthase QueD [Ferroacidibacillus organovorans]KUO95974.1 6-pyruvoyl tetrahydrobiopterin synthase [Ferroacidibacillus organovorans]
MSERNLRDSVEPLLYKPSQEIALSSLRYHDRRVTITKEFTFDAAHHLYAYKGKCANLHGHTYRLVVSVSDVLDEIGLSIDFGDVKALVKTHVVDRLDHTYLNEVLPPMNTTAENMIVWMFEEIERALHAFRETARVERLTLYETPTSSVEITRQEMGL